MVRITASAFLALLVACWPCAAAGVSWPPELAPLLEQHCVTCHEGPEASGNFDLAALPVALDDAENFARWELVFDKLAQGEMPPPDEPRPPEQTTRAAIAWLRPALHGVSAARQAREGRVVLRRLTRQQYEHTLHDLLHITVPLADLLPEDRITGGFDNIGAALDLSSVLMERYLEAADVAIDAALWHNVVPRPERRRYSYRDEQQLAERFFGQRMLLRDDAVVFFMDQGFYPTTLQQFRAPADGRYRFRISAYGYQSHGEPVSLGVHVGDVFGRTGERRFLGCWDMPPDEPRVIEFETPLLRGNSIRVSYYDSGYFKIEDATTWPGSGLAVQWVEVEGPRIDRWPSASYRTLFGDLEPTLLSTGNENIRRNQQRGEDVRFTVGSSDPRGDARHLLFEFLARAFRRPSTEADLAPILAIVESRLDQGYTFEEAMRVGYRAVLASPAFLYLWEQPGELDDFALASRLSYFLSGSLPDDELRARAADGTLDRPEVLRAQVERLLDAPTAQRFVRDFVGQWLDLRNIDFTSPDQMLYPEHDELLQHSMVRETELFFSRLLDEDHSVANFVDSDFSMLNGRLARHYGVDGVTGHDFRPVTLPPEVHRGGVITHASVLKVTANGTTTSPVLRGKWLLDRILGTPASAPPGGVPAVEPDIRGATTIREQLAAHRTIASCAACHRKIDPPGFALESYDVIGGWRERYRIQADPGTRGPAINVLAAGGRERRVALGPEVDASYTTHDGRHFRDIDEFKQILLADRAALARCVAGKLLVYATGGELQFADRAALDAIVAECAASDYGLRSLVHAVVQSQPFRHK